MYKRLGILGGMGPLATYTLYKNIIEGTPARKEQEHIDIVILNAPYIPDRTHGILYGGESPLPYLLDACKRLENDGCDLIVIPCNTSHYFYDELQNSCKANILNMVDLAGEKLESSGVSKVYLMATEGTVKTGVYEKYFTRRNINIMTADDEEIAEMMRVIYEVKAGKTPALTKLYNIMDKYCALGCEKIILGCTEFSALNITGSNIVDVMEILKDKILELFGVK